MLASRLPIAANANVPSLDSAPGVQQILILPKANKACILCNGVVTFYSLPELSPTYGTTKVNNCNWIGGVDLNEASNEDQGKDPVIMIAMQSKVMLVRIGDEPRRIRNIEFPGCLVAARRDTIACVADGQSYSLLEVEHRQKIPLLPISSSEDVELEGDDTPVRTGSPAISAEVVSNGNTLLVEGRGHGRSSSLNAMVGGTGERRSSLQPNFPERRSSLTPEPTSRERSPNQSRSPDGRAPGQVQQPTEVSPDDSRVQPAIQKPLPPTPKRRAPKFKPHIVSPTPSEFLFVTGTEVSDPGVGTFVNLDGEGVRGAIEFRRFPESIVLDNAYEEGQSAPDSDDHEGYVLAIIKNDDDNECPVYIEAQRWDEDPGEAERRKTSISIPLDDVLSIPVGMHRTTDASQTNFTGVAGFMQMVRLKSAKLGSPGNTTPPENADPRTRASIERLQKEKELFDAQESDSNVSERSTPAPLSKNWEMQRSQEEAKFAKNLGNTKSSTILWRGNRIWRVARNPLALQLENTLRSAEPHDNGYQVEDPTEVINILDDLKAVVPKSQNVYLGLNYVRQKASLLLFLNLITVEDTASKADIIEVTEKSLVEGGLDPRIILLLVPLVQEEVLQGPQGIWVNRGLASVIEPITNPPERLQPTAPRLNFDISVLYMLTRYLLSWQKKRGYASVADERYVFDSVDAALLHLLLELDTNRNGHVEPGSFSIRAELNKLVDNWKGNFDRAVELLDSYRRLYVLSRLYQSRKMARHVLRTWRRIIEGENDIGGELSGPAAEVQVRKYLVKIRDIELLEEYGSWLAGRNASLGVQVFADDSSRIQLEPGRVVSILKERAPGAVQVYLEHLVFAKNVCTGCSFKVSTAYPCMLVFRICRRPHRALSRYGALCPGELP